MHKQVKGFLFAALLLPGIPSAYSGVPAAAEFKYDGTLGNLATFSERYDLGWKMPAQLDYFKNSGLPGALRYAHWVPEGEIAGTVVHFNGRTEFIERNIGVYQDLLKRNFEVWAMDWRGQGFSDRQYGQVGFIASFDDYLADAETFVDEVVQLDLVPESRPKVLLAHSMGGQIAMRYLLKNPGKFDSAVMSSPLLALPLIQGEWYSWAIYLGNIVKTWVTAPDTCLVGSKQEWQGEFSRACDNLGESIQITDAQLAVDEQGEKDSPREYSHDYNMLNTMQCLTELSVSSPPGRDLRVSCATSVWTRQALLSIDTVMDNKNDLETPTLILASNRDQAVSNRGQRDFCDNGNKNCCLLTVSSQGLPADAVEVSISNRAADASDENLAYPEVGHELLVEEGPIRQAFLSRFYAFVGNPDPSSFCST